MSNETNSDLVDFQQFISAQISSGGKELSPEECLSRYRAMNPRCSSMNPTDLELDESVVAIATALRQKERGAGKSLDRFNVEFRTRHFIQ